MNGPEMFHGQSEKLSVKQKRRASHLAVFENEGLGSTNFYGADSGQRSHTGIR